jgi:glutathionyl-hydroquinone reductase
MKGCTKRPARYDTKPNQTPTSNTAAEADNNMAQNDTKLTLYTNPICPFAHRALLTATEKGLSFETVVIALGGDKPDWYGLPLLSPS